MPKNDKYYKRIADKYSPSSPVIKNCIKAFLSGGLICTFGQVITNMFTVLGFGREDTGSYVSIIMVFIGAVFTGLGWYSIIAKHAGAGTLVPITGFSNAVTAPAVEYKAEGMITGIAAKMFVIAGPVIVYGVLCSWVIGLVRYVMELII